MPTGGKDSGAARLTPAQQRALRQLLAKAKASQREAKQTQAKAQHVNDRKPKPTETRAETAARQNAERSRRDLAARRHGRPADYGQSLPDSVHPPRPTRAQVEKSRRRSDPLAGAIKTAGALTGPLARDVAGQPKSLYENVKYLTGQRKTQPKPPTESAVFYPALAKALAKSVAEDVKDPKHHKLNLALDVAAFASGGASTAGRLVKAERALREGKGVRAAARATKGRPLPQEVLPRKLVGDSETGTRRVKLPEGGSVQPPHQSPSIPTAAAQHVFDRLSEKVPGLPGVGSRARARRIVPEHQALRDRRAAQELGDLAEGAKKLRGRFGGTTAKEAAYSAIADFGHGAEGVKLLDADIARRKARLAAIPIEIANARTKLARYKGKAAKAQANKIARLKHELRTQTDRIMAWKAAREFVAAPHEHPDLVNALVLGEAASKQAAASRVERGALRAETAAAAKDRKARIAGGEEAQAGAGSFFTPDVEGKMRGRSVRTRSVNRPQGKIHKSEGVLFSTGRNKLGPRVTLDDALKETRHRSQAEDAKLAESFSTPYKEDRFDPRKHVLLNPEGAKVPRYLRTERPPLELEQATPREIAEHWLENRTAWAQEVFPKSVDDVAEEHRLGLRMIDKKMAEAITGRDRHYEMVNSGGLLKLLDTANNLTRAAYIYLNPSYIPKNFAGNLGFLALQQGPFAVKHLARSSKLLGDLSPETLRRITSEAGGGAAVALMHDARGFGAAPLRRLADVQGAGADRLPRIAAWLYEAERRGYKTEAQIEMLLRERKLRPVLTEISEAANQAMVKFARVPTKWRRTVSRAIFIAPWVEGATRYVGRLALDRPLAARAAQDVRERVEGVQEKAFGEGRRITAGRIPFGKTYRKLGTTVTKAFNPVALSPVGQAAELADAVKNAAGGNWEAGPQAFGFAQPAVVAGIEALSGIDTYRGRRYPHGTGGLDILRKSLLGDTKRPAVPLADVAATALREPQTEPFTDDPSKQPNYIPEAGLKAAALKLLLGSARPTVEVNIPAVKAKGASLAGGSPVKRAYQSVFKRRNVFYAEMKRLGQLDDGRMPKKLRTAFNIEAERQAMYAHGVDAARAKPGTAEYHFAKFGADTHLLVAHHQVDEAEGRQMLAWAERHRTDLDKLKDARRYISETYYQAENAPLWLINESRKYLEERGAKGLSR